MKSKIFMSMLVILVAVSLVVGGTMAYFTDTVTSSANVFTSGTVNMKISNLKPNYGKDVTVTWKSPTNWAPGDPDVEAKLYFTNTGTIDIKKLRFTFTDVIDSALLDKIIVTELYEKFDNYEVPNQIPTLISGYPWLDSNSDGKISLRELVAQQWDAVDDKQTIGGTDGILIAANNMQDYTLGFRFKFDTSADNTYQDLNTGFKISFNTNINNQP